MLLKLCDMSLEYLLQLKSSKQQQKVSEVQKYELRLQVRWLEENLSLICMEDAWPKVYVYVFPGL